MSPEARPNRNIVVIGASAGGITALRDVVRGLNPGLRAAVFIVCHTAAKGGGVLSGVIGSAASLPTTFATDDSPIQPGTITVAPADHHLILDAARVRLTRGPKHNRARPSIDVLFRSAAEAHGPRVIGVVLTGLLDDGSAGLLAIKRRGGLAVVQDPGDARFPDMPRNALAATHVDHCLPVVDIGPLLQRLTFAPIPLAEKPESNTLELEVRADAGRSVPIEELGRPSGYACPECGGVLWEICDPDFLRFRCRVGHMFSAEGLRSEHEHLTEDSLWAAVRALKESAGFARRLAERYRSQSLPEAAEESEHQARRQDANAEHLLDILTKEGATRSTAAWR